MVAPNSSNFVNNWKLTVRIFFNYSQWKVRYYEAIGKNNEWGNGTKKASLLTFICVTSEFSLNFNIGPIKPKLDTIKVKIKKNTPSSAIIVFN